MQRASLPLHGVKVLDFGQYIAGPAVAMILADFGATVIHVDPLSGPLWENPANATLNRNKLTLRLRRPAKMNSLSGPTRTGCTAQIERKRPMTTALRGLGWMG